MYTVARVVEAAAGRHVASITEDVHDHVNISANTGVHAISYHQ
jgi:hypothetical protein